MGERAETLKAFGCGVLAMAALLGGAGSAQATVLADGGFEAQGAASTSNYCYFTQVTPGGGLCAAGAWTGDAGFVKDTSFGWPGIATPDGNYFGFVQGQSYLAQDFSVAAGGNYLLSWLEAGRAIGGNTNGNQTYTVTLTNLSSSVASLLYTGSTTTSQPWTARSANTTLGAGNYRLTYQGTVAADSTAFIDAVSLSSAVPEPGTWVLMMAGIGLAGFALRRRPALRPAAA